MFKRSSTLLILFTGIAALFLGACSKQSSSPSGKAVTYNLAMPGKTIDPQLCTSAPTNKVIELCIEGLVLLGEKAGEVIPGGAKSWDISKDGTVYTFHLRKDAVWSNGEKVTAHDYYYGLKRALTPSVAAQNAYMLYDIINAKQFNQSEIKDFSQVGIKIIDDYTFELTLTNGVPYFTQLLANTIAAPLNEKFFKKVGSQYALSADTLLYNGAYIITEYIPNGKIEYIKNNKYWNKKNIKIDKWTFLMVSNYNTSADMFQSGELDITVIKGPQIPQFKGTPELITKPDGSVWYLQINIDNKFFKNANIRKAMSMAINREVMVKDVMKDGSKPAYAFVPPGIAGGKVDGKLINFRQRYPEKLLSYNVAEAKKLYQKGLKEIGYDEVTEGKAKVELLCQSNPAQQRKAEYLQQQLFKNLGLNVILKPDTFQAKIAKVTQKNYDFALAGWGPNYNYPTTFLNMWVTNGGNNDTNFSNATFDKEIRTAETNDNGDIRIKALHKSEILLMNELPIIPLYFEYRSWLIKPWLKGIVIRSSGTQLGFLNAYIKK